MSRADNTPLTNGSLFTGTAALDMAVESVFGARTVWFCDNDPAAIRLLSVRHPNVPNHGDITKVDWTKVEPVDIISGGSPCQDLSIAGRRAGMQPGTRSNLWESMREAIAVLKPKYVVWENVYGAFSAKAASEMDAATGLLGDEPPLRAFGRLLGDLAGLGYDARWQGVRVTDLGGGMERPRVFVLATLQG